MKTVSSAVVLFALMVGLVGCDQGGGGGAGGASKNAPAPAPAEKPADGHATEAPKDAAH